MATRPSGGGGGWAGEARIGIEAAAGTQTDEDLAPTPLEPPLHLDRIVAGVEDEQGSVPFLLGRPAQNRFHLLDGDLVGVLRGRTRSTSTGAVQLSRTKLSRAMNW